MSLLTAAWVSGETGIGVAAGCARAQEVRRVARKLA